MAARESDDVAADSRETKDKKTKVGRRGEKDELWCAESKFKRKKTDSEPWEDRKQWEIDCKDSICSFDSHIDLAGEKY